MFVRLHACARGQTDAPRPRSDEDDGEHPVVARPPAPCGRTLDNCTAQAVCAIAEGEEEVDDEVAVQIKDKAPADRDSDSDDSDSDQSDGGNQNEDQEIADTMLLKPVFVNREDRAILEPSLQL